MQTLLKLTNYSWPLRGSSPFFHNRTFGESVSNSAPSSYSRSAAVIHSDLYTAHCSTVTHTATGAKATALSAPVAPSNVVASPLTKG